MKIDRWIKQEGERERKKNRQTNERDLKNGKKERNLKNKINKYKIIVTRIPNSSEQIL